MAKVVIMDHPLIKHKIGYIRREETGTKDFPSGDVPRTIPRPGYGFLERFWKFSSALD